MSAVPDETPCSCQRSQFDLATGRERKTNTHIPFKQTLAMDRFLADADPERRQRSIDITRDMMSLRGQLHALQNQKVGFRGREYGERKLTRSSRNRCPTLLRICTIR
jgi:ubiquitin carboxyl-terminal hydrolase 25/28